MYASAAEGPYGGHGRERQNNRDAAGTAGWFFLAGIVIFSGSLYVLSLTEMRWLGAITPIGGVAFLIGWLILAWAAWR